MKNRFKRGICLGLVTALTLVMASGEVYAGRGLTDYEGHWAAGYIDTAIERGYISPLEDGRESGPPADEAEGSQAADIPEHCLAPDTDHAGAVFGPDMIMTRAVFVQALAEAAGYRMLSVMEGAGSEEAGREGTVSEGTDPGKTDQEDAQPSEEDMTDDQTLTAGYEMDLEKLTERFNDLDGSEPYARAAAWAGELEIVNGTGQGFSPDQGLDRQTLAVLMFRTCRALDAEPEADWSVVLDFVDIEDVDEWAVEGISFCCMSGLMTGNADGSFAPKRQLSRAESAVVIVRLAECLDSIDKIDSIESMDDLDDLDDFDDLDDLYGLESLDSLRE